LSTEEVKLRSGKWQDPKAAAALAALPHIFEHYVERHIRLQTTRDGALLRESTQSLYRRLLRVNLRTFKGRSVESITTAEISEWWAESIKNGNRTTASKAYKLLSSSMKRAVSERIIHSNPCMVTGAQTATSGKTVLAPSEAEVADIASNINPRYTRMVLLMAYGGFRFGEVTELRRKDVLDAIRDGKACYDFRVDRAVTLVTDNQGKTKHKVDKPKSAASSRTVPVSSLLKPMIDSLLNDIGTDPNALLFPSASNPNKHLLHSVFMNSWRPALRRSGIPEGKYSPHGLRHFAGSHIHKAGAMLPDLKEWLGDSSTAAVMRYVHSTGSTATFAENMPGLSFESKAS
jgi:integrase